VFVSVAFPARFFSNLVGMFFWLKHLQGLKKTLQDLGIFIKNYQ
jgi:hypothetical protein